MSMDGTAITTRTAFGSFLREVARENATTRSRIPSLPSRDGWRQLSEEVQVHPAESLRSVVYRACATNDLPNSWGVLQHTGLPHRNEILVAEHPDIDLPLLAHAIRISHEEVLRRRYDDLGRGRRSFFGLAVPRAAIENRIRRFSPAAFRADAVIGSQSGERAFGHHRATWELRALPFCLDHWDMLHEACPCEGDGVIQRWTRTASHLHECDRCGDPLATLESFAVPEDMRPALGVLTAIVDPIPSKREQAAIALPASIRGASRSRMFHVLTCLADALDPQASSHPIDDPRQRLNGLWRACLALTQWPNGLHELAPFPAASPARWESIRNAWFAITEADPADPGWQAKPAENRRVGGAGDKVAARKKLRRLEKERKPIGLRPATETARLSPEVLAWAWETGLVTQHRRVHGPRDLPAFDRAELLAFSDMWSNRVAPDSLAYEMGISLHGVEQLAALGVIPARAPTLPGTGRHFFPEDVEDFFSSLEAEESRQRETDAAPLTDAVTLIDAMRRVSGRAKPWGPALALLLRGGLPYRIQPGTRMADSIVVCAAHVETISSLQFDRSAFEGPFSLEIVQNDALNMLNVSNSASRVLAGLPFRGVNPKVYRVRDVEARALSYVTLPEIALRLRMIPADAYSWLRSSKLVEAMPGLWNRNVLDRIDPPQR